MAVIIPHLLLVWVFCSWYTAADFQLYLIGPLLVMVAAYSFRAGMLLPLSLALASITYTFAVGMTEEWSFSFTQGAPFLRLLNHCKSLPSPINTYT